MTEAVIRALREDDRIGKYSLQPGMPELKEEIGKHLHRTRGVAVDAEREVFISCGSMEAFAGAICTVIDPGEEVLVPSPNYASHIEQILFAEGVPVFVPMIRKRRMETRRGTVQTGRYAENEGGPYLQSHEPDRGRLFV